MCLILNCFLQVAQTFTEGIRLIVLLTMWIAASLVEGPTFIQIRVNLESCSQKAHHFLERRYSEFLNAM